MAAQQLVVDNVVLSVGTTIKEIDYQLGPCMSNYSIKCVSNIVRSLKPM